MLSMDNGESVLILVVMDVALWLRYDTTLKLRDKVLILVVMDVALWLGRPKYKDSLLKVLILVVMDVALWQVDEDRCSHSTVS